MHATHQGDGPPLVLLHAFPLEGALWQGQIDEFSKTHRVIVPDLPGFGRTPLTPGWGIDSAAAMVAKLLDQLAVTKVTLGGLSMGGYIALSFARQFPDRLSKLILCDTRAEADDAKGKEGRAAMIAKANTEGSAAIADAMLPKLLGETTRTTAPQVEAHVRALILRQKPEAIAAALAALRDRPDATPGLKSIAVPTLVIVGEEDIITPPPMSQFLTANIPNATLVTIPKCGHLANLESPAAFNAALRAFL